MPRPYRPTQTHPDAADLARMRELLAGRVPARS